MNASLNEKAQLYKVVRALLGKKPNGVIELEDLKGKSCLVDIEHYQSKGQQRSKITSYATAPNSHGVCITEDDLPENLR